MHWDRIQFQHSVPSPMHLVEESLLKLSADTRTRIAACVGCAAVVTCALRSVRTQKSKAVGHRKHPVRKSNALRWELFLTVREELLLDVVAEKPTDQVVEA